MALRADIIVVVMAVPWLRRGVRLWLRLRLGRRVLAGTLDDLVEFASIEPDATALRAIVDLYALAFAHHQCDAAGRANQA
ncbi:hypothetical protein ASD64_12320 [Mesorhizobium sp. Root157]|nr:hypothetical protein ASD64_12320 [Mesorhizobium sp. Root157]